MRIMYNVKFPLLFYEIQFSHVFWELFSVNKCPISVYFSERLIHRTQWGSYVLL